MWRCKRCETDNADADILCNGCDWHSPNLVSIDAILLEGKDTPTYVVKWNFTHSSTASIDNDIGEVSSSGEITLTIKEKTKLIFTAINEFAEKTFSKILLLPPPIIEYFFATENIINLNKSISLSWLIKYADKIILSNFGDVTGTSKKDILLDKTSILILTAENAAGKAEKSIPFELPLPVISDFKASSLKTIAGDEIFLSWVVYNSESLILSGLSKEENLTGDDKKIILDKSSSLILNAINNSGTITKTIHIEVIPKPEIKILRLNRPIALVNDEIEITWNVINFSKLFLLIDGNLLEVTDKKSFKFIADNTKDIKLICESIENLKIISQILSLKVIEKVSINYLNASSLYTLQSKPILLSWGVSNASEIFLLPLKKKLDAEGTLSLMPSTKTVYTLEARNELTKVRREIEIDVLPLPSILNIRLVIPPKITLPSFYESRITYPLPTQPERKFFTRLEKYLTKKFTIKEPKSLKTTFISFTQHSEYTEIKRKTSLMRIVSSLKSLGRL